MSERMVIDPKSLSDVQEAVVIFDPRYEQNSIVASSSGLERLTGFTAEDIFGQSKDALLKDVPAVAVSRSAWKNFANYCHWGGSSGLGWMGESSVSHPFSRKDGSVFVSMMTLGRVAARGQNYVAAIHLWLAEGPRVPHQTQARSDELQDTNREGLRRLRQRLYAGEAPAYGLTEGNCGPPNNGSSFYSEYLLGHTMILSGGASAARREPDELPSGCMLFGGAPLRAHAREGLSFALRVDGLSKNFHGLPFVGFTRTRPGNHCGLYPRVAKCLGRSVFVGGLGEAFSRRQEHNFEAGFRKIPQEEIASWCLERGALAQIQGALAGVKPGDIIESRHNCEGHIQFWLNRVLLFDFDVGFPPEAGAEYWPVVDICNCVSAMTLLGPSQGTADHALPMEGERLNHDKWSVSNDASTASELDDCERALLGLDDGKQSTMAVTLMELAAAVLDQKVGSAACGMGILGLALAIPLGVKLASKLQ